MKKTILIPAFLFLLIFGFSSFTIHNQNSILGKSFYDLSIKSLDGKSIIKFSDYKGKKILCVNTASQCGFTEQYAKLEKIYEKYKSTLVVIGFPCNQFGEQEPWDASRISEFCRNRYNVSFPMSEKIQVKGDSTNAVYQWLTQKKLNGVKDVKIRWNFGKFLISEKGKLLEYFPETTVPDDPQIISLIEKK